MRRQAIDVVLLAAILFLTASPGASYRRYPTSRLVDYHDHHTTSCLNYCTSRISGATFCCPTATGTTYEHGGNLVGCGTHSVNCHAQQPPPYTTVVNHQPRVVYRQAPISFCGQTRCNPSVPVTIPPPVIYPRHECPLTGCNPVAPVCVGHHCHPLPPAPVPRQPTISCSLRGCRRRVLRCDASTQHLVVAVDLLVQRSYANGYTMESFIDGLQTIIDNQWTYSWYGECAARDMLPDLPESRSLPDEYDDVDNFDGSVTTTDHCHPCSAAPRGVRQCSTRFQTVIGACDNCCQMLSRTRARRSTVVLANRDRDFRKEVSRLTARAPGMTRRSFLGELNTLVRNALAGRYRWNQTEVSLTVLGKPLTESTESVEAEEGTEYPTTES